jgi:hypothetical protein
MKNNFTEQKFLLCINNSECDDLVLHKVYSSTPDKKAEAEGFIRIIDESGEDYLYPQAYFSKVHLSRKAQEAVSAVQ